MSCDHVESKVTINIYVDKKRNKVVFAEASKDFIDILFSFLTFPMGTIARLVEKRESSNPMVIGCLNNLYRSVEEMGTGNFQSEACKEMLLCPRSVEEEKCRKLKVNLNDIEAPRFFVCSRLCHYSYSNFETLRCQCGQIMNKEATLPGESSVVDHAGECGDGVFVDGSTMFLVTDDLRVMRSSMAAVLEQFGGLGVKDARQLEEAVVNVGFSEVLTLLRCLFNSTSALTDTFLARQSSQHDQTSQSLLDSLSPQIEERTQPEGHQLTLRVFLSKLTRRVLHVECGEDFVDLLFTFLVIPPKSVLELSGSDMFPPCVVNLFRSFNDLEDLKGGEKANYKCELPPYYSCCPQLLDIRSQEPPNYIMSLEVMVPCNTFSGVSSRKEGRGFYDLLDPRVPRGGSSMSSNGFAKRKGKFVISDALIVTPMASTTTMSFLKKLQISSDEIEEQVISIGQAEATALLRASMLTSSALTSAFASPCIKKPKIEP